MLHEFVWDPEWRGFICRHCGLSVTPEDMADWANCIIVNQGVWECE